MRATDSRALARRGVRRSASASNAPTSQSNQTVRPSIVSIVSGAENERGSDGRPGRKSQSAARSASETSARVSVGRRLRCWTRGDHAIRAISAPAAKKGASGSLREAAARPKRTSNRRPNARGERERDEQCDHRATVESEHEQQREFDVAHSERLRTERG